MSNKKNNKNHSKAGNEKRRRLLRETAEKLGYKSWYSLETQFVNGDLSAEALHNLAVHLGYESFADLLVGAMSGEALEPLRLVGDTAFVRSSPDHDIVIKVRDRLMRIDAPDGYIFSVNVHEGLLMIEVIEKESDANEQ